MDNTGPTIAYSVVARSTDDDGDYTFCEEAEDCMSISGLPIHEVYKFHAPEDGQVEGTKRVTERVSALWFPK